MKARDIMTTDVVCASPQSTVTQAVRIMLQRKVSGLPVVADNGVLVGMITEGDLLRRIETGTQKRRSRWLEIFAGSGRLAADYTHTHGRKVEEVMSTDPVSVTEHTSVEEVVKTMEKHRIKRVPVVLGGRVVGIISRANLLHAFASVAREIKPADATDAEIRERLLTELKKEPWAPVGGIDVIVRQGVVELWGMITDERLRPALIVAAENTPGVKAVRDHLTWIDTMSGMVFVSPTDQEEQPVAEAS